MSAGGLSFTMDLTLERLIQLFLSKKRSKNTFQAQVVPITGDWACAPWLQQHSISTFLGGHPVGESSKSSNALAGSQQSLAKLDCALLDQLLQNLVLLQVLRLKPCCPGTTQYQSGRNKQAKRESYLWEDTNDITNGFTMDIFTSCSCIEPLLREPVKYYLANFFH